MNEKAEKYWAEFWKESVQPRVDAWQFGCDPDELARLVIEGKKTATCSSYIAYEMEKQPIPAVWGYSIILDSEDEPVAIIQTVDVQVMPMNEVTAEFAAAEGEGDLSYEYWWNGHKKFFTEEMAEYGKEFLEDMLVVCERFQLVDVVKK